MFTLLRIIRTAWSNLLIGLTSLLIVTNISFAVWTRGYRQYMIECCNPDSTIEQIKGEIWVIGIASTVCIVCWNLVHWIYAYKYWTLSLLLPAVMLNQSYKTELECARIVNITMIVNILGWQGFYVTLFLLWCLSDEPISKSLSVFFYLAIWSTAVINLFSCFAIGFSFCRLHKFSRLCEDDLMVDAKMMTAHALSYALTIISLVSLLSASLTPENEEFIHVEQYIFLFSSSATQLLLITIFNKICQQQIKSKRLKLRSPTYCDSSNQGETIYPDSLYSSFAPQGLISSQDGMILNCLLLSKGDQTERKSLTTSLVDIPYSTEDMINKTSESSIIISK